MRKSFSSSIIWLLYYHRYIAADAFTSPSNILGKAFTEKNTQRKIECISPEGNRAKILFDSVKEHETLTPFVSSKYYLLTLDVWKTIIPSTLSLFALKILVIRYASSSLLSSLHCSLRLGSVFGNDLAKSILLPLLSSACCGIQLLLNAFLGLGCAGFNTFLGPLRPAFISMLLFSTINSFSIEKHKLFMTLFSWCVAVMPEIIHYLNGRSRNKQVLNESSTIDNDFVEAELNLKIEDMGCVACINKIDSTIRNLFPENIASATSWLSDVEKGGEAKIVLRSSDKDEIESITSDIISAVQGSGFKCQLKDISISQEKR